MAKTEDRGAERPAAKLINLALQGGGAHGAFTWGVLDRILEDDRIEIDSVTGASAGAMNAVVLADGLIRDGREGARERLAHFWAEVGRAGRTSPVQRTPIDRWFGGWSLDHSPGYFWFDVITRIASPYDLNPLGLNLLRDILARDVDFEKIRCCSKTKLFISATNVETGQAKVFEQSELTCDHIMASACIPFLFRAVEIDGAPYWDGGYMGNPPLWPLFDDAESDDVVIVQINPMTRPGAPRGARDILNRLNEITFNASLMRELRAVDFVTRLIADGRLEGTGYRRVLTHMISDEVSLSALGASSKLNAEAAFLKMLFQKGRNAADGWIAAHFDDLGARSTIDFRRFFGGEADALDGARIRRRAKFQTARRAEGRDADAAENADNRAAE